MKTTAADSRRVVVTGLGIVSPIGIGKESFWRAAVSGTCGVGDIESFDSSAFPVRRGCEVKDFSWRRSPLGTMPAPRGRATRFAAAAAAMALEDARIGRKGLNRARVGISLGTTGGEIRLLEEIYDHIEGGGEADKIDKAAFFNFPCNGIAARVADLLDITGPNMIFPNACAAGNYAAAYGFEQIKRGRLDVVLAGGVEPFSRTTFTGFCRMKAVAPDLCRPFDKNRKGIMLGEGAAVLVLEAIDRAKARDARVYAEIAGYGTSCDSFHVTSPNPDGSGMMAAMKRALATAGLDPGDIDYISAHGTGTPVNDRVETLAVKKFFGAAAGNLLISSIKGMIGHTMGAAAAVESVACALVLERGVIPPTVHYQTPDPDCDLDYVVNQKKIAPVNVVMNNAFAFGGENTSLVMKRYVEERET